MLILTAVGKRVGVAMPRRDWRAIFFAAVAVGRDPGGLRRPGVLHVISALPLVKGATLTRIPIVPITGGDRRGRLRRRCPGRARQRCRSPARPRRFGRRDGALSRRGSDPRRPDAAALVPAALGDHRRDVGRWSLWAILLAAGTALAVVRLRPGGRSIAGPSSPALTALVALDLFVAARGFHPLQPADRVYPAVAELTRLRDEPGPLLVVGAKGALMPNSALVYGVQDVRGLRRARRRAGTRICWTSPSPGSGRTSSTRLHDANSPILDLLGIRYLMAPRRLRRRAPRTGSGMAARRRRSIATVASSRGGAPGRRLRRSSRRQRCPAGGCVTAAVDVRRDVLLGDRSRGRAIARSAPPRADAVGTAAHHRLRATSASRSTPRRRGAGCWCCRTPGSPAGAPLWTAAPASIAARQRRLPRRGRASQGGIASCSSTHRRRSAVGAAFWSPPWCSAGGRPEHRRRAGPTALGGGGVQ